MASSFKQPQSLPRVMTGVILTGHGGPEKLEYRENLPVPILDSLDSDEVLIKVAAAGINNTDINTRIAWYSKSVKTDTKAATTSSTSQADDATWSGTPMHFPRIQGADCCGRIVAIGSNVSPIRIGERVLVRSLLKSSASGGPYECWTFGSECDGGFAQYTKAPARETYKVDCDWTDIELGSIPCAYSTAEGMLHRAKVKVGETVLITGASGGVGAAAVQLAKRRKAKVIAVCGADKMNEISRLGADEVIPRGDNVVDRCGKQTVDVVVDLVAGPSFADLLDILKRGGRYVVAGAIAGPLVELDVRTLYLKDLSLLGCTFQEEEVFANLVSYIERGEISPHMGNTYELRDIVTAQEHFMSKATTGKLVLRIPHPEA